MYLMNCTVVYSLYRQLEKEQGQGADIAIKDGPAVRARLKLLT
jgi:hypothetical protein